MGVPTVTARTNPDATGHKLKDGYQVLIAFASAPGIELWEKSVKPPGFDGGEKVDQTTMFNEDYTTAAAQTLIMLTDGSAKVAYDPDFLDDIQELINQNQSITVHFPNHAKLAFHGYLKSFEPDELVRGTQPTATIVVVVTNLDPADCTESGPILIPSAGSCFT